MLLNKKNKIFKYSDLSSGEQKSILKKSVRKANEEQRNLVETFDKEFNVKQTS
jgi:hypothetical protein